MLQNQQELPIEFNPGLLYTVGNITGNVTDIIIFHDNKKLLSCLFEGGAQIINSPYAAADEQAHFGRHIWAKSEILAKKASIWCVECVW